LNRPDECNPNSSPWQKGTGSDPSTLGAIKKSLLRGACPLVPRADRAEFKRIQANSTSAERKRGPLHDRPTMLDVGVEGLRGRRGKNGPADGRYRGPFSHPRVSPGKSHGPTLGDATGFSCAPTSPTHGIRSADPALRDMSNPPPLRRPLKIDFSRRIGHYALALNPSILANL
jgi:hypothetical protein